MKEILLSQNKIALVDNEDYERLSQFDWTYDGKYAKRTTKMSEYRKRKTIRMSQEILGIDKWADHKDGNGLNNQRSNLRLCNNSQNQQNKVKTKRRTSSKYKGVCTSAGKWSTTRVSSFRAEKSYISRFFLS